MVLAAVKTSAILYEHTVIEFRFMAKASAPRPPTSYELLAIKLQKAINSPMWQKRKYAILERLPDDHADDWSQILEERDDGSVQVFWTVVKDD
jgi:hypothetical protein